MRNYFLHVLTLILIMIIYIYIFNELKLGEFVKKYDSKLDFNPKSIPKLESNVKLT